MGLLAVGLILTVLTTLHVKAGVESGAQREFDFACNEIRLDIDARLEAAAQILRSGVSLFDASEAVSRGEWRMDVQVIMMTGEPTAETAAEAVRGGASDCLVKPVDKNTILRAVAHAANVKALNDIRRRMEAALPTAREK